MDQKPPTATIESAHRDHLTGLPFDDTTDFEDADRGFIGALEPCVVKAADGRVVWDNDAYAFLTGDAPTIGASQPVAAEPAVRQAGPLRGGRGHLPGARLRPVEHQLHRGRHRCHRHRSADLDRDRGRGARPVPRPPRRPARRRRHLHPQPRRSFRRRARRDDAGRRRRGQGRGASRRRTSRSTPCRRTSTPARRWRGGPPTCTAPCWTAARRGRSGCGLGQVGVHRRGRPDRADGRHPRNR